VLWKTAKEDIPAMQPLITTVYKKESEKARRQQKG
jgi:hypothetical protein